MTVTIDGTTGISSVDGSSASPSLRGSDSNSGIVYAADTVSISTGGTTRVTVDSAGLTQFNGDVQFPSAGDNNALTWDKSVHTLEWRDNVKAAWGDGDDLQIYHDGTHSYLKNTGGNLVLQGNGVNSIVIQSVVGENAIICNANNNVELYYDNGQKFQTNSEGVSIKNSGDAVLLFSASNGAEYWSIRVQDDNFRFLVDASERMRLSSGGNIGAPNGSNIYNASDQRLKENITTLTNGLDKIKALNPVSFNWIDGFCDEEKDKTLYGVIAQEAQVVDSNLVNTFSTGTVTVKDQTIENTLTVNEKFIIPLLIKAVQELSAEVETLKTKVAALEAA